jgi:ubiquinone/menaquinone biosynthesis C-methylase UbiE
MATDPNTIDQYNLHAADYDRHISDPHDSTFHHYYEKPAIRAELPPLNGLDVISIGCGSGADARWLADNGATSVVGIDISSGLLEIARSKNPDITFHEMDMEDLALPDSSFDIAYSSLAIHYVDNWIQPLREAYRILREGGQYVFSCGHPIDSSMEYETIEGFKYARLGRRVNLETRERSIYGDYLAAETEGVKPISGTLSTADVVVYHRTFSKMIEQINASGFTIDRLIEPQPTEKMRELDAGIYDQLSRIPSFMIWVLKK